MRLVSFYEGDRLRPGIVQNDRVLAVDAASAIEFLALPADVRASRTTSEAFPLEAVKLGAPVHPRKNVLCVGRNYLEHAKEGARASGRELKLPSVPTFFTKAPTSIAAPDSTLSFDAAVSKEYDWEAELAVVIGSTVKDVPEERALDAVFGYTCLNDITARDLQRMHLQWFKGKSLDGACPMGPWIVSADEIGDAQNLTIALRVNGVQKQSSNTSQMIFHLPRIISELSKGMTLEPGDVIATGTPDGVGFARTPPEFFVSGDVVEVDIQNIGVLRNRIAIA